MVLMIILCVTIAEVWILQLLVGKKEEKKNNRKYIKWTHYDFMKSFPIDRRLKQYKNHTIFNSRWRVTYRIDGFTTVLITTSISFSSIRHSHCYLTECFVVFYIFFTAIFPFTFYAMTRRIQKSKIKKSKCRKLNKWLCE